MSDQTTLSTLGSSESDRCTADEPTSDCSSRRSSQQENGDAQIDVLRSAALDQWVADRTDADESYGYLHLFLVAQSDLSGVQRALRSETRIEHDTDDAGQPSPRFSSAGVRAANAHERILEWKLGLLAVPLHPELRTIPTENLRVFVADPAREYLAEEGVEIESVVEQVNTIDEHTPTEEDQLERRREYARMKRLTGVSSPLEGRIRAIEDTLRARFEFTSRYGHDVPDPDPAYKEKSLDTLEKILERARREQAEAESRCEELWDEISATETEWIEATRSVLRE